MKFRTIKKPIRIRILLYRLSQAGLFYYVQLPVTFGEPSHQKTDETVRQFAGVSAQPSFCRKKPSTLLFAPAVRRDFTYKSKGRVQTVIYRPFSQCRADCRTPPRLLCNFHSEIQEVLQLYLFPQSFSAGLFLLCPLGSSD